MGKESYHPDEMRLILMDNEFLGDDIWLSNCGILYEYNVISINRVTQSDVKRYRWHENCVQIKFRVKYNADFNITRNETGKRIHTG